MNLRQAIPGLLAVSLLASIPASAAVLWRGDLSSGDLSQWSGTEAAAADRLQVVTSPVHHGAYALRAQVDQGDLVYGGCRAELFAHTEREGSERYYAWSTLFPSNYPVSSAWQVFTQWHHSGSDGSPPLSFDAESEQLRLISNGANTLWSAPLVRGVWHDFVFHVKFSSDPKAGFVEVWLDGARVLARTAVSTIYAGQTVYLKQGLYRSQSIGGNQVVYHSGMIEGETLADVVPAPKPTPDFTVTAVDQSQSIAQGQSATFRVRVDPLNGFSGAVSLSVSGLAAGATAKVEQGSAGDALVVVTASPSAALGASNFTITGRSGGLTHATTATLVVSATAPLPPSGDFSLALAAPTETAAPGTSASFAVSTDRMNGFAGSIALSASGLPLGAVASSATATAGSGSGATLGVEVAINVEPGSYPFTIVGTSGGLQRTAAATLVVSGPVSGGGADPGAPDGGSGNGPGSDAGTGAGPATAGSGVSPGASGFPAGGCTSATAPACWALGLLALLWRRKRRQASETGLEAIDHPRLRGDQR